MIEEIIVSNPDYRPILEGLESHIRILRTAPEQMHQISQMATPPGILAICHLPGDADPPETWKGHRAFYLDAIRDPGNLGTILRIADWFGIDYVILSPDCVDIFNQKVLQASMGSALRVKVLTLDASGLLLLPDVSLFVCDAGGRNIYSTQPPAEGVIVLGNESLGVTDELLHQINDVLAIPGHRTLGAESLNVASAAAIMAAWWTCQPSPLDG